MFSVSPAVTDNLFQITTLWFSVSEDEKQTFVPLSAGVTSAEPLRPYWPCSIFYASRSELEVQILVLKDVRHWKKPARTCFCCNYKGHPYGLWKGCWWTPWNENACGAHVTLPCYLSRMCQENVYTELQTKNTEAADLWRSWITKGGYPRPSRVSSAAESAVDDKEVFYHVRLWNSLSLVLGWTNAKLFLQTAHITKEQYGLGKLTLR